MNVDSLAEIQEFALRYTAAWCSRDAHRVAQFFAPDAASRDNDGPVHKGREAIAASAQSFMTAFPDLVLLFDGVAQSEGKIFYRWILEGTHSRTGRRVRIPGSEEWRMSGDRLIAESTGRFDVDDFNRQAGLS